MDRLFDVYIAVDWSARSRPSPPRPSPDSVWVGERLAPHLSDETGIGEAYWRTRHAGRSYLRDRLLHHVKHNRRVFIGLDFPYGYPSRFSSALDLNGDAPPWRLIWNELTRLIVDNEDNSNNRFDVADELNSRCGGPTPGPLWGHPVGRNYAALGIRGPAPGYPYPVRPGLALERLRWADRREKRVQPIWKLFGNGSVGSQCLVGIPTVCRLRDDPDLSAVSRVWPFETGFTSRPTPAQGPFILHVEIWPGIVPGPLDASIAIRDQAQVRAMVDWLSQLDDEGRLGALFDTPDNLSPEAIQACVEEEGWIIGGGWQGRFALSQ